MSFLYNKKKQLLNAMNMLIETLNKRRQCVSYLYTCKSTKLPSHGDIPLIYLFDILTNNTFIKLLKL